MRHLLREGEGQDLSPPAVGGGRPGPVQEVRPTGVQGDQYARSVISPSNPRCVPFHEVREGDAVVIHGKRKGEAPYPALAGVNVVLVATSPEVQRLATIIEVFAPNIQYPYAFEISDLHCELEVIASAQRE